MGCELLTEEHSTQEKSYGEIFDECFAFYLAIGMSSAEYWTGDPSLVRYYRQAYQIRQEEQNNNAWLQGLYVYDAVSTALYNFGLVLGKGNKPLKKYAEKPYTFHNREKTEAEKAREVAAEQRKAAAWMEQFVALGQSKQSHRAEPG